MKARKVAADGREALDHLRKAVKHSLSAKLLASRLGMDCRKFDVQPLCHAFHDYSGYALSHAIICMVRHGADTAENFKMFFGRAAAKSSIVHQAHQDAVASTPRLPPVVETFVPLSSSTMPVVAKETEVKENHQHNALWCDDEPYFGKVKANCAPISCNRSTSNSRNTRVLLPAMNVICGRRYITHKRKPVPTRTTAPKTNYFSAKGANRFVQKPIKTPQRSAVVPAHSSPTSVADAVADRVPRVSHAISTSINSVATAADRFPPLPKHLVRNMGSKYTPPEDGVFDMQVSSVMGTIFTGAANARQPVPKMMLDGAHDRDDSFMTHVF